MMRNKIPTINDVLFELLSKGILKPMGNVDDITQEFKINPTLKLNKVRHRNIPMNVDIKLHLNILGEIGLLIEMYVETTMLGELVTTIELFFDGEEWGVFSYYDETRSVGETRKIYNKEDLNVTDIEYDKPLMRRENIEYVEGVMEEALYVLSVLNS